MRFWGEYSVGFVKDRNWLPQADDLEAQGGQRRRRPRPSAILRSFPARRSRRHNRRRGHRSVGTSLRGADLRGAYLRLAKLDGADLSDANLDGAEGLTQAQLDRAHCNSGTKLPAGLTGVEDAKQ
jgi:hypothetical protein